ncbi:MULTISPECIES: ABC transporter permease [unclassified Acidiphilium]|uniref:ABC transporter permease n=1 Tax=unclassified Acidiphilium TaxID=2617493 RepID=UPI000BCA14F4|nr:MULTISPECIES: ABC transporter permease [unclassified Acidiphilium]OYV57720.1 MAG: macrolide ABC transporter ATP-binding protein/permease [Acidiphilium sp. 20-67-58]HQT60022.1 ABC transporter permease [Acidiphilium sp.]
MTAAPVIQLRGIGRLYGSGGFAVHALRDVDLVIERGEFVAIMGSSGSGKSTLMAILGCLDRPSCGEYRFEGVDVAGLAEPALAGIRSARIGFVFQSFNLLARTSALDNVALPLVYAAAGPVDGAARRARARTALGRLGLAGREANTPAQLSGGQQQRVAIARALINAPQLLLADEPTGNLDTRTSHEIMATLAALNSEQGVTILVVTHEQDIARYARRVLTMRDGRIVADERQDAPAGPSPLPAAAEPAPAAAPARAGSGAALGFVRMIVAAALQALARNRLRAALTMLGVCIGVAALIAMVAVGQGANQAIRKQIEGLGTNLLVVLPGATTAGGAHAGFGSASTITVDDARAILREDPAVGRVGYLIRAAAQVRHASRNWTTATLGVSPDYPAMTNWRIAEGRPLTSHDEAAGALVGLIGQTVRQMLFARGETALGATMLVKGAPIRIVGVLAAKGQTPFGTDQDDVVMLPFSTAEQRVLGAAAPSREETPLNWPYPPWPNPYALQPRLAGYVNQLFAQATTPEAVPEAMEQIGHTLSLRHRIQPDGLKDFSVRNLSQIAAAAQGSSRVMALLLAIVASISLLVGGIGIMNILLVSVTERTREIGLRMAIGARRLHVLLQFLAESVILSVTGGLAGIVLGATLSGAITLFAGWPAPLSPLAVAGGFLFAAGVGVGFGFYPARKASRLDPIEALRYE